MNEFLSPHVFCLEPGFSIIRRIFHSQHRQRRPAIQEKRE